MAHTYWVDSSCEKKAKGQWKDYWQETMDMAKKGADGLASTSNNDLHNVFRHIFNTEINDNTNYELSYKKLKGRPYDIILGVLKGIATDWKPTDDRLMADARFFCDDGQRWKQSENHPGYFEDDKNMVLSKTVGCRTGGIAFTSPYVLKDPQQKEPRNTIDLCDKAFDQYENDEQYYKMLAHIPEDLNLADMPEDENSAANPDDANKYPQGLTIQYMRALTCMAIFHEMCHLDPYDIDDTPNGDRRAYGWQNVVDKNTKDSLDNADNYAYFALWGALAVHPYEDYGNSDDSDNDEDSGDDGDGAKLFYPGYTLPRDSDYPDLDLGKNVKNPDVDLTGEDEKKFQAAKQKRDADVRAGLLRGYKDLTKRSLGQARSIGKGFAA
ncbi:MAG: hypothetical protein Q9160_007959 [Pyrenula sp. 1 TL-2023]